MSRWMENNSYLRKAPRRYGRSGCYLYPVTKNHFHIAAILSTKEWRRSHPMGDGWLTRPMNLVPTRLSCNRFQIPREESCKSRRMEAGSPDGGGMGGKFTSWIPVAGSLPFRCR